MKTLNLVLVSLVLFGAAYYVGSSMLKGRAPHGAWGLDVGVGEALEDSARPIESHAESILERDALNVVAGTPARSPDVGELLLECAGLSSSEPSHAALRNCIADALKAGKRLPSSIEFGDWICQGQESETSVRATSVEILRLLPIEDVFVFLDQAQLRCNKFKSRGMFRYSLQQLGREDPDWLESVARLLTPDLLFNESRGVAVIHAAAALMAVEGGDWAEHLLDEGGQGNFGGTLEQIRFSCVAALTSKKGPKASLQYIEDVMLSPNTPGGAKIGNHLVIYLFARTGQCWINGDPSKAIELANLLLDDSRFSQDAALQLLGDFSIKSPPRSSELDSVEWAKLLRKAQSCLPQGF